MDDIRGSKGPNVAANGLDQFLLQLRAVLGILHEGDICIYALPLHWVLIPAHMHRSAFHSASTSTNAQDRTPDLPELVRCQNAEADEGSGTATMRLIDHV